VRDQCDAAGVPIFIKQLGADPHCKLFTPMHLDDRKGGNWNEWPEDLRVREFPNIRSATPPQPNSSETV